MRATVSSVRTFERSRSVVVEYGRMVFRWIKVAVVAAAILVVAWFVLQFIVQAAFVEWLGDRIDNLTGQ